MSGDEERLANFYKDPAYERRLVIFYDVLGWRSHIKAARRDVKKIGELRRLILQHGRSWPLRTNLDVKISTFSDNVVISQPLNGTEPLLLTQMAFFQVAAAMNGFLLRGGITVGDLVHDDECVFGPGLNRAYQLESEKALFPRLAVC